MDTARNRIIGQDASFDAANAPAPPKGRFQFSLKTLLIIVAILPPAVGLFSGAFGEVAQGLALIFVFGLIVVFGGAIVLVTTSLLVAFPLVWLLDGVCKAGEALFLVRRRS